MKNGFVPFTSIGVVNRFVIDSQSTQNALTDHGYSLTQRSPCKQSSAFVHVRRSSIPVQAIAHGLLQF